MQTLFGSNFKINLFCRVWCLFILHSLLILVNDWCKGNESQLKELPKCKHPPLFPSCPSCGSLSPAQSSYTVWLLQRDPAFFENIKEKDYWSTNDYLLQPLQMEMSCM